MFSQGQPRYYAEEQGLMPPLGLLCVAGYLLEKAPGHDVEILDMPALRMGQEDLARHLAAHPPDLVGVTCLTNLLYDTVRTLRTVKRIHPHVPLVLGGYHTQLYPQESLEMSEVDAIVLGAGEVAFHRLAEGLAETGEIRRAPGVLTRPDEVGDVASEIQRIDDPDALPLPARHLTPYKRYVAATSVAPPTTVVMTSFGCPFRCIFCNTSHIRKIVARSPARIVDEFSACGDLGIREFIVQDENFTVNRPRVMTLCEEIHRRKLDIVWSFKSRVDLVDRELLRAVRRAGCCSIHFGIESGDEAVLKTIRKDITPDQVRRAFRLCKEEGVETTASFMMGFPDESRAQIERTIAFALEVDPNYVQFSIAIPLPATELYRLALERGLYRKDHWKAFVRNPTPDFKPPGWYETHTAEELEELLETAYRRFYLRPRYILRRLRGIHNLGELARDVRIGLRFIRKR